jgi:hypothetical protein
MGADQILLNLSLISNRHFQVNSKQHRHSSNIRHSHISQSLKDITRLHVKHRLLKALNTSYKRRSLVSNELVGKTLS